MEWPLIGRDSVLRRLTTVLSQDGVQGIEIVGDAGVGKTRLSTEIGRRAQALGREVETIVVSRATEPIPYGALAHLLPVLEPGSDRGALHAHLVTELKRRATPAGPLVVTVDDVHHLDAPSAEVLQLAAVQEHAFLILTRRSARRAPGALAELWKDGVLERMEIGPLSRPATERLIVAALDGPVDGLTLGGLWRQSRGNPLFVRELVTGALETGILERGPSGWHLTAPLTPSVRLVELVQARFGQLDADEQRLVQALAVGGSLETEILERLVPSEALERLEDRRIVELARHGNRHYARLAHPLYDETVTATMPRTRVRQMMRTLAELLDAAGGRRREDLMRLALWQLEGGGRSDASVLLAGANRALAVFDPFLAERLARAASADAPPNLASLLTLGEALTAQQRVAEAERALDEAAALATGDDQVARVALARGNLLFFRAGRVADAARVLAEASSAIAEGDWRDELDSLLTLFRTGAGDLVGVAEAGRRLAERPDARPRAVVHALMYSSIANAMLGHSAEARAQVEIGLERAAAARDAPPIAQDILHINDVVARMYAGQLPEALAAADDRYATAVETGAPELVTMWGMILAECQMLVGAVQASLHTMLGAVEISRVQDPLAVRGIQTGLASVLSAWLGREQQARSLYREFDDGHLDRDVRSRIQRERAAAWITWLDAGAEAAAHEALAAGDRARAATHMVWAAFIYHDAVRLGYPELVANALADLADLVEGRMVAAMAMQAAALANGDAVGLERAASAFESMGAMLDAAEAAAQAQAVYLAQGRARLARVAAARAAVLARACPGVRTPALTDAAPVALTERELEIAQLAARGLPSRDIAGRLRISVRTVDNHLGVVYGKLGVAGRRELPTILGIGAQGPPGPGRPPLTPNT
jgi:DNA-binding CsgD family transcriptional regulator